MNHLTQHAKSPHRRPLLTGKFAATTALRPKPSPLAALASTGAQHAVKRLPTNSHEFQDQPARGRTVRQNLDGQGASRLWMAEGASAHAQPQASFTMSMSDAVKSIFPLSPLEQVTDAQLSRYARLIYNKTGIRVSPRKKMLLSNRLRRRLRKTGIESFDTYYRYLQSLDSDHAEWDEFFQEITTHETYFFRDENHWDWFSQVYLPQRVSALRKSQGERRLRIWSVACSTGDEVYTIACCIAASLPNLQAWQVNILGTDIAGGEIQRAKQAVFGQRAMRLVPEKHRRFFEKSEDTESWSAKPILRNMVHFRQHNLMDPLKEPPFDIVFLKNVLIYFDQDSKREALGSVCPMVRPGGLLVAGAAEGVSGLISGFQRLKPWLFHRG